MRIAITGSSGFTGKYLTKYLSSLNYDIIKIDLDEGIDLTNLHDIKKIPKFDVIFHLAAKSFVPDSYKDPHSFYNLNINSTLNTLELCKKYNAKYIYISTYVYGNPQYLPIDEKHTVTSFNPYADSKLMGENLCHSYNKYFNLRVIIVRPFNIYGPNQTHNFLIPFIFNQAIKGKIELNDPNPKRDLIYIDDLIEFYSKLISYDVSTFEIFNAGFGKSYSVYEIVNYIKNLFPHKIDINFLNITRPNEILNTVCDNNKANKLLNWTPKVDLFEGLSKIYKSTIT